MDKQQLEAIRARDADYNDVFEAQASMSKDIAHRLVAWPVADRRALLGYVDALVAAASAVSVASAAITLHPDGRAYFDSGAATKHFRGALAALLEVLAEVLDHE